MIPKLHSTALLKDKGFNGLDDKLNRLSISVFSLNKKIVIH
jgi:hypothetical protein